MSGRRLCDDIQHAISDKSVGFISGITLFFVIAAAGTVHFKVPFAAINAAAGKVIAPYQLPAAGWFGRVDLLQIGLGGRVTATTGQQAGCASQGKGGQDGRPGHPVRGALQYRHIIILCHYVCAGQTLGAVILLFL